MSAGTELTDRRPASASIPLSRGGPPIVWAYQSGAAHGCGIIACGGLRAFAFKALAPINAVPPLETENNNSSPSGRWKDLTQASRHGRPLAAVFTRQQLAALRESASAAPAAAAADWRAVNAPPVCPADCCCWTLRNPGVDDDDQ